MCNSSDHVTRMTFSIFKFDVAFGCIHRKDIGFSDRIFHQLNHAHMSPPQGFVTAQNRQHIITSLVVKFGLFAMIQRFAGYRIRKLVLVCKYIKCNLDM
jgi:hypothetical protein